MKIFVETLNIKRHKPLWNFLMLTEYTSYIVSVAFTALQRTSQVQHCHHQTIHSETPPPLHPPNFQLVATLSEFDLAMKNRPLILMILMYILQPTRNVQVLDMEEEDEEDSDVVIVS